eukprot:TRINITY_DN21084_c0_g2_i1.p1 TRINITY_DN21084_c0_g2~~TRINITY_DN21084_c0_g2_i1.p1  ORF type:complete len:605 (+),score=56.13 TRINITY_DN21084_c0_g2_i1:211-2025(+)
MNAAGAAGYAAYAGPFAKLYVSSHGSGATHAMSHILHSDKAGEAFASIFANGGTATTAALLSTWEFMPKLVLGSALFLHGASYRPLESGNSWLANKSSWYKNSNVHQIANNYMYDSKFHKFLTNRAQRCNVVGSRTIQIVGSSLEQWFARAQTSLRSLTDFPVHVVEVEPALALMETRYAEFTALLAVAPTIKPRVLLPSFARDSFNEVWTAKVKSAAEAYAKIWVLAKGMKVLKFEMHQVDKKTYDIDDALLKLLKVEAEKQHIDDVVIEKFETYLTIYLVTAEDNILKKSLWNDFFQATPGAVSSRFREVLCKHFKIGDQCVRTESYWHLPSSNSILVDVDRDMRHFVDTCAVAWEGRFSDSIFDPVKRALSQVKTVALLETSETDADANFEHEVEHEPRGRSLDRQSSRNSSRSSSRASSASSARSSSRGSSSRSSSRSSDGRSSSRASSASSARSSSRGSSSRSSSRSSDGSDTEDEQEEESQLAAMAKALHGKMGGNSKDFDTFNEKLGEWRDRMLAKFKKAPPLTPLEECHQIASRFYMAVGHHRKTAAAPAQVVQGHHGHHSHHLVPGHQQVHPAAGFRASSMTAPRVVQVQSSRPK